MTIQLTGTKNEDIILISFYANGE